MRISRHGVLNVLRVVSFVVAAASPAFAQVDLSGEWAPIRAEDHTPNPDVLPGDYVGLPMADAARMSFLLIIRRG